MAIRDAGPLAWRAVRRYIDTTRMCARLKDEADAAAALAREALEAQQEAWREILRLGQDVPDGAYVFDDGTVVVEPHHDYPPVYDTVRKDG